VATAQGPTEDAYFKDEKLKPFWEGI